MKNRDDRLIDVARTGDRIVLWLVALAVVLGLWVRGADASDKPQPPRENPVIVHNDTTAVAASESHSVSKAVSDASASAEAGDVNAAQNLSFRIDDRLQAPSINAPPVYASGVCAYGWSAGLSVPGGGLSGGRAKESESCNRRELARVLTPLNPQLALTLLCADPMLAAVATPDQCVYRPQTPPETRAYVTRDEYEADKKDSQTALERAYRDGYNSASADSAGE